MVQADGRAPSCVLGLWGEGTKHAWGSASKQLECLLRPAWKQQRNQALGCGRCGGLEGCTSSGWPSHGHSHRHPTRPSFNPESL